MAHLSENSHVFIVVNKCHPSNLQRKKTILRKINMKKMNLWMFLQTNCKVLWLHCIQGHIIIFHLLYNKFDLPCLFYCCCYFICCYFLLLFTTIDGEHFVKTFNFPFGMWLSSFIWNNKYFSLFFFIHYEILSFYQLPYKVWIILRNNY